MKRFYLFLVSCILLNAQTYAQAVFQWGKAEGKYAYDYGYSVKTDNQGNVYVAGKFEENDADFSGTKLQCQGNHDAFVAKYDPAGNLIWIETMGGPNGDYAWSLSTDKTNYLYVSGEIENENHNSSNTITFSNSTITISAKGDNDAFLAKYDLDGNLIWAFSEGHGTNSEKGIGNAVDKDGNIFMCGYFSDETLFNGQTFTAVGGKDIYVAKYDASGNFQWFRQAGSVGRDEAKDIVCDDQGNVYICGAYDDNCKFGTQNLRTFNNTGWWDAFIAKYDKDGNLQWVKTGGGDVDDMAWSITIDNAGSLYIGGEMAAWAKFGTNSHTIQAVGEADGYIAKYDQGGNIQWVKNRGTEKVDRIRGIGTDGTNILATGQFGGYFLVNGDSVKAVDTSDIFITVISPEGAWGFLETVGGSVDAQESLGYESGNAITGTADGNIYATGGLLSGGIFGPSSPGGYTRTDVFITKLTWSGAVGLGEKSLAKSVRFYPNPTSDQLTIELPDFNTENVRVNLYNCVGEKVHVVECVGNRTADLSLSGVADGLYFVELESAGQKTGVQKLLIRR